jgi:phage-related holin
MDIVNEDYKRNKPNNTFKTEKDLTNTLRIRLAKVSKTLQHTVPKNNNVTKVTLFYYIDGSDILDMYNKCNFPVPEVLLNSIDLETAEIKKSMRRA